MLYQLSYAREASIVAISGASARPAITAALRRASSSSLVGLPMKLHGGEDQASPSLPGRAHG